MKLSSPPVLTALLTALPILLPIALLTVLLTVLLLLSSRPDRSRLTRTAGMLIGTRR